VPEEDKLLARGPRKPMSSPMAKVDRNVPRNNEPESVKVKENG